jgi:hypothetical protein
MQHYMAFVIVRIESLHLLRFGIVFTSQASG